MKGAADGGRRQARTRGWPSAVRYRPQRRVQSETMWGILCVAAAVLGCLLWDLGPLVASFFLALKDWSGSGRTSGYWPKNLDEILLQAVTPALDLIWTGEATAQAAMDQAVANATPLMQGVYQPPAGS